MSSLSCKLTGWVSALALVISAGAAHAATKVACAGEQTTHSAHRTNDPEYPLLLGKLLDPGFSDGGKMALYGGGFVEGSGPLFAVGNFAHPQGTVLVHDLTDPKTYAKSDEYQQLRAFTPDIVVLGPFGWHETLAKVPLSGFPTDYDALIDSVRTISSQPRVVLVTPVPEAGVDKKDGFTEINGYVNATATRRGLPLIDVWTEFLGKPQLYQDDFHLTLDGRTYLAEVIGKFVKQLADAGPLGGAGGGGAGGSGGVAGSNDTGGGGVGGSSGQGSDGGSLSSAGSLEGGHAGAGSVVGGAAATGGYMMTGGSSAAIAGQSSAVTPSAAPPSSSASCSYPISSSSSPSVVLLGLGLLGLLRRERLRRRRC